MAMKITWDQIHHYRMDRHFLSKRASRREIESVVQAVCGIQAQMPAAAQLQLWARINDLKPVDVSQALWESRTLLRTWCMRGTAHYISTSEFPYYLEAIIKPRIEGHKRWLEKRGLKEFGQLVKTDPNTYEFETITKTIQKALQQGPATRENVADIVAHELGPEARPWVDTGYYIVVKLLAYQGQVCFGPDLDGKTSLVLTDLWLPKVKAIDQETAENILLINYLKCYGPATPQDFAAWSGLKMTKINSIWDRLAKQLAEVILNQKSMWLLSQDLDRFLKAKISDTPIRLLPHFDVFLLGHKDKTHIVDETHYKQVFKKAAWIAPVLLLDGQVIGTWKQKRTPKKIIVIAQPFTKLTESQESEIAGETQRLGDFFELTPEVKVKQ